MKITRQFSFIDVVGKIWLPAITCSMRYSPDKRDVENMRDDDGKLTRESVAQWLACHSGDFQCVEDFYADIETPEGNFIFDWSTEDGEEKYLQTLPEIE